jgi:hypothetical protein
VKSKKAKVKRKGSALLVVLLIVMAITILSLGFLSRSDVELACGENMILRTQMDYLAESGLEHARGLILNPQDVNSEYWSGDVRQQLATGSDDYYDVSVVKLGECNYQITCNAYREKGGERIGQSSLEAELRLDPCIAVRTGDKWLTALGTMVNGDVCAKGSLLGTGNIRGDAFSTGTISAGNVQGQKYANIADINAPVSFPSLVISDFSPQYYIGSNSYSADIIGETDLNDVARGPTPSNPAGVYYRDANLTLYNNVVVNGTLVVKSDLIIRGRGNSITAMKNFPAVVVVDGKLQMSGDAQLAITGLAQIKSEVKHTDLSGASLSVLGALFIQDGSIAGFGVTSGNPINVTAAPDKAAIEVWPTAGTVQRWSPVGGAFFKSIGRL